MHLDTILGSASISPCAAALVLSRMGQVSTMLSGGPPLQLPDVLVHLTPSAASILMDDAVCSAGLTLAPSWLASAELLLCQYMWVSQGSLAKERDLVSSSKTFRLQLPLLPSTDPGTRAGTPKGLPVKDTPMASVHQRYNSRECVPLG